MTYLIFDGRYHTDPDGAAVMEVCDTLAEAKKARPTHGADCVIVECNCSEKNVLTETGKTW